jgi:hypothetical protein
LPANLALFRDYRILNTFRFFAARGLNVSSDKPLQSL